MKRRLRTMAWLVFLGALANLVVAWLAIAAHGIVKFDWRPFHNPRPGNPIACFAIRKPGAEWVVGCGRPGTLVDRYPESVRRYEREPWWPPEAVTFEDGPFAVAAGWPMLSFSAWRTVTIVEFPDNAGYLRSRVHHWGLLLNDTKEWAGEEFPAVLPLRPVWPGFVVNTLLYAAALWLVFDGRLRFVRRLRTRRGLCPACAYPLRTVPPAADGRCVCPECGGTWRIESATVERGPA